MVDFKIGDVADGKFKTSDEIRDKSIKLNTNTLQMNVDKSFEHLENE